MPPFVHTILVPQGVEYQAIYRGLRPIPACNRPIVLPIPVGPAALSRQLQDWQHSLSLDKGRRVLITGLCGALTPEYPVGEVVLYQDCVYRSHQPSVLPCDRALTALLQEKLHPTTPLVTGLTSDRMVSSAQEKSNLAQRYGTSVVDMESFTALQCLHQRGVAVAVLRVVSDDSQHDVPDLTPAFNAAGAIQPRPLALGLLRQPIAAFHLIRGALQGLQTLQTLPVTLLDEGSERSAGLETRANPRDTV